MKRTLFEPNKRVNPGLDDRRSALHGNYALPTSVCEKHRDVWITLGAERGRQGSTRRDERFGRIRRNAPYVQDMAEANPVRSKYLDFHFTLRLYVHLALW